MPAEEPRRTNIPIPERGNTACGMGNGQRIPDPACWQGRGKAAGLPVNQLSGPPVG